eukprot:scaffold28393_cov31-Tisochrysis_lutea.AAC.2
MITVNFRPALHHEASNHWRWWAYLKLTSFMCGRLRASTGIKAANESGLSPSPSHTRVAGFSAFTCASVAETARAVSFLTAGTSKQLGEGGSGAPESNMPLVKPLRCRTGLGSAWSSGAASAKSTNSMQDTGTASRGRGARGGSSRGRGTRTRSLRRRTSSRRRSTPSPLPTAGRSERDSPTDDLESLPPPLLLPPVLYHVTKKE